jgi:Fe-Mn family superoxide dismutase
MNNKLLISLAEEMKPKKFPLEGKLKSVSDSALIPHRDTLYHNYVKNYNRMVSLLEKTDFSKIKDDVPNSQFAQLKRRITWAANGAYLHELYFGNIGENESKPGKSTLELIKKDFKDFKNFKDNFTSTAMVPASGWAVWGYALYDQRTYVAALESHHDNCPIGFFPILVLDMWEHAYWKDHLAKKKDYVKSFWEDTNWDIVEKRCKAVQEIFSKM